MKLVQPHSRFLSWYIGAAIIAFVELYMGLKLVDEGAPELAQQAVLVAVPLISLALMFLALKSQK